MMAAALLPAGGDGGDGGGGVSCVSANKSVLSYLACWFLLAVPLSLFPSCSPVTAQHNGAFLHFAYFSRLPQREMCTLALAAV